MEISQIMEVISTVAFPIAMCVLEAWYIKYQTDQYNQKVAEFNKSLDANTQILTKLTERLEGK